MIQRATVSFDWSRGVSLAEKHLELSPASSRARYYKATAMFNQERWADAAAVVQRMQARDEMDRWPVTHSMLGTALGGRGEFEEGPSTSRPPSFVRRRRTRR